MGLTVSEMIDSIREQIDEDATSDIKDEHILRVMNRALNTGYRYMVNSFPDPLVTSTDLTLTETGKVALPDTIFEDRVLHVDLLTGGSAYRIDPGSYSDIHNFEFSGTSNSPSIWAVVQRDLYLRPNAAVGTQVRVWHVKAQEKLVKPQGRITRIGADYFVVDSYGNGLSTDSDEMNSFFNVVDFSKGNVKWTGQVKTIVGDKITHKSTATRSTFLNLTVSTDQSEASPAITVDDYICEAAGTCIPYMPVILENYIIQASVVSLMERLNYDSTLARGTLGNIEKELKKQWAGRAARTRFQLTTAQWKRHGRGSRIW